MLQFTIDTAVFYITVQKALRVTTSNKLAPMTEYLLLEGSTNNILTVTSSDLENTYRITCPMTSIDSGSIVLLAHDLEVLLSKIHQSQRYKNITVSVDSQYTLTIQCSKTSKHVRAGLPASQYFSLPSSPSSSKITIQSEYIEKAFHYVTHCLANTDSLLSTAKFTITPQTVTLVGTNSQKLCEVSFPSNSTASLECFLSKRSCELIRTSLYSDTSLSFSMNGTQLCIETDTGTQLYCNTIQGTYPEYTKFFEISRPLQIQCSPFELTKLLSIVYTATPESRLVVLSLQNNELHLTSQTQSAESHEYMNIVYSSDSYSIGLNVQYLLEVLQRLHDDVITIQFGTPITPIYTETSDDILVIRNIIVPMRLL